MQDEKKISKGAVRLVTMGQNEMVVKLVGGLEEEHQKVVIRAVERLGPGGQTSAGICCDGLCCNGLKQSSIGIETTINQLEVERVTVLEHVTNRPK